MTVTEIKAALTERGVEFPAGARKGELEQLLEASGGEATTEPAGAAPAGRSSAARHAEAAIARIDVKVARLQERREQLTRIAARERSGGTATGPAVKRRTRKQSRGE